MGTWLAYLTLAAVLLVVVTLVIYLLLIIAKLRGANHNLSQLAAGLQQIEGDTHPLEEKMTTINTALQKLLEGLLGVNDDLAAVARLLRR